MNWLFNNLGTIAAALMVVAIILGAAVTIVNDRRKGKSSCGCDCSHCGGACGCHKSKS